MTDFNPVMQCSLLKSKDLMKYIDDIFSYFDEYIEAYFDGTQKEAVWIKFKVADKDFEHFSLDDFRELLAPFNFKGAYDNDFEEHRYFDTMKFKLSTERLIEFIFGKSEMCYYIDYIDHHESGIEDCWAVRRILKDNLDKAMMNLNLLR